MNVNKKKGFTLIELIVVIAILGILAAVAVPRLSGFQGDARAKADASNLTMLNNSVEAYNAQNGSYPVSGATAANVVSNGSTFLTLFANYVPSTVPTCQVSGYHFYYDSAASGNKVTYGTSAASTTAVAIN